MSDQDDYVYDDESGEWVPASDMRAKQAEAAKAAEVVVRDSLGNILADGDQVTLSRISMSKARARSCAAVRSSNRSA